ncbi:cytochrome b [Pseudomonas asplenii]|uniref:Cytochrome b561 n=1 Tax=Pseudomonas asplenii TaxID=53407 RepID=A0A1H6P0N4_9PSED|nr:cytochrome b/b6 domain-containing protein [Pseudomonas fuscovaginae]SEI20819.1 cytochrome b561 [Pseudomonas fuscovaginae]
MTRHPHSPAPLYKDSEAGAYSKPRIFLHWLSAVVILWATFSGFGVTFMDRQAPLRQWVESLNPQLTSLFIPFFAWRLWLAIKAPARPVNAGLQARLARLAHVTIYATVTGVLVTGVLMMNHPVEMLDLFELPQLVHSRSALAQLHQEHHVMCALLGALVALHLLAVVQHQVMGRPVLGRMLNRQVSNPQVRS